MPAEFTLIIRDEAAPKGKKYVNLSQLARLTGYTKGHVSRVFRKETTPSMHCAISLAGMLGMGLGDFIDMIEKGEANVIKTG